MGIKKLKPYGLVILCFILYHKGALFCQNNPDIALIGRWPNGPCHTVFVADQIAYVGNGAALDILDISNIESPVRIGQYVGTGFIHEIIVTDQTAYVAADRAGLLILDVSDPASIIEINNVFLDGPVSGIFIRGDSIYLCAGQKGLHILDVSVPSLPVPVDDALMTGQTWKVFVDGNYAYVAAKSAGFSVFRIQPDLEIVSLFSGINIWDVAVDDAIAYLADENNGLTLYNVSNPESPDFITNHNPTQLAAGVVVKEGFAYVAAKSNGMVMVDIEDPLSLEEIGMFDTGGNANDLYFINGSVFLADGYGGMKIIDVSHARSASIVSDLNIGGQARDTFASDDYAYLANGTSGLQVVDIHDPTTPSIMGSVLTVGNARDIFVVDSTAFIAAGDSGLQIVRVPEHGGTPLVPDKIGSIITKDLAQGVFVSNNNVFVADGDSGLQVIDASIPASPILLGYVMLDGYAVDVHVSGNYAYVGIDDIGFSGLNVVDVSLPSAPNKIGDLLVGAQVSDLFVADSHVYIADRIQGLHIVDIGIPETPTVLGSYVFSGAEDIYVTDDTGYLVGNAQMIILDLSDPGVPQELDIFEITDGDVMSIYVLHDTAYVSYNDGIASQGHLQIVDVFGVGIPELLSSYPTGYPVSHFDVWNDTVYVAAGEANLHMVDFTDLDNPFELGQFEAGNAYRHTEYQSPYIHIAEGFRFRTIDANNPNAPFETDNVFSDAEILAFTLNEHYAYLAVSSTWSSNNGLKVLDLSNPYGISEAGHYGFDIEGDTIGIDFSDGYIHIADDFGLHIFDVHDPENPAPEGFKSSLGHNRSVRIYNQHAFMTDISGLEVIDIGDPTSPYTVDELFTSYPVLDIDIADHYGYMTRYQGVDVVDIGDPLHVEKIDSVITANETSTIRTHQSRAYVGHERIGFSILGLPTHLKWLPDELNYDTLLVGRDSIQALTLINPHQWICEIQSVVLSGTDNDDFSVIDFEAPATIPSNDSLEFTIRFDPQSEGMKSADLIVQSNYDSSPDTIGLSGFATTPVLTVSDTLVHFGYVLVHTESSDSIYIKNAGSSDMRVDSLIINGSDSVYFQIDINDFILAPADSHFIRISFAPNDTGWFQAALHIFSDGGDTTVYLWGMGTEQLLSILPTTLLFDETFSGYSRMDSILFINTGLSELMIGPISREGSDTSVFHVDTTSFSLSPADSQYVSVKFSPDEAGFFSAWINILSTSTTSPDTVRLYGNSIDTGLMIHPDSLEYGYVFVNDMVVDSIKLRNMGENEVHIDSLILQESSQKYFIVDTTTFTLTGGDSAFIDIWFLPDTLGSFATWVYIYSDISTDPDSVYLHGTGSDAYLDLSTAGIDFGDVLIGTMARDSIYMTNTGTVDISVGPLDIEGMDRAAFIIDTTSFVVTPGDTGYVYIYFDPDSARRYTSRTMIFSNTPSSPDTVYLAGTGVQPFFEISYDSLHSEGDLDFSIAFPSTFSPDVGLLFFRTAGKQPYHSVVMTRTDTVFTGTLPAGSLTIRGIEYYVRMTDDIQTLTYPMENPQAQPAIIQVYIDAYQPALVIQGMKYRMISIPAVLQQSSIDSVLADDYGIPDKNKWRVLRHHPVTGEYFEYPAMNFNMIPGTAFWLITRRGDGFDLGPGWSVHSGGAYRVPLAPGWNQVANPFAFAVALDSMTIPHGVEDPVWFDGNDYDYTVPLMNPWDGYFIFNQNADTVMLSVPPVETPSTLVKSEPVVALNQEDEYMIQFVASVLNTSLIDKQNYIGMLKNAEDGADELDFSEAPPIGDYVRFSILGEERRSAGSFKSISEDGQHWDVEVTSSLEVNHDVIIEYFTSGSLSEEMALYILNTDDGCVIPCENNQFYVKLTSDKPVKHFRIILGTSDFAEELAEGIPLIPVSYHLGQNFPNPFNPETTIEYQLAKRGKVTIEIYNIIGSIVRIFIVGEKNTGRHQLIWDGRDDMGRSVAAGVYFYQIRASDFRATKKMVLIR